jgi:hypothetical protein
MKLSKGDKIMTYQKTMGSYTDPKTGLKVVMVKTADDKIKGLVKITSTKEKK